MCKNTWVKSQAESQDQCLSMPTMQVCAVFLQTGMTVAFPGVVQGYDLVWVSQYYMPEMQLQEMDEAGKQC